MVKNGADMAFVGFQLTGCVPTAPDPSSNLCQEYHSRATGAVCGHIQPQPQVPV